MSHNNTQRLKKEQLIKTIIGNQSKPEKNNSEVIERPIFWEERYNYRARKIDYDINKSELRIYLQEEGFRTFGEQPIQLKDNIAKIVSKEDIFKHTLKYVESQSLPDLESMFITQGNSLLLKNSAITISLPECEKTPLRDSETISYLPFLNDIVVIEADKPFRLIAYSELESFVWEKSIIRRNFNLMDDENIEKSIFSKFVANISNSSDHFNSICTSIGYLLHGYKDQRKPIAIIINDENPADTGNPEGGTGKGLLIKAVSQIVERASYNGKNADFTNNKFAYQNVQETTSILLIDDAPRNFDFEALFSVLTDDLPIEKKHQSVKVITYSDSPKFVITTNYTIKGDSSSFKRRRFDIFLNSTYHSGHTPADDFGEEFFHGWTDYEWQLFDLFMVACLRMFLSFGLMPYDNDKLKLKRLKNETSSEFYELMEDDYSELNVVHNYISVTNQLINVYGEKYKFLNNETKRIVGWILRYAEFKGFHLTKGRNKDGTTFVLSDIKS